MKPTMTRDEMTRAAAWLREMADENERRDPYDPEYFEALRFAACSFESGKASDDGKPKPNEQAGNYRPVPVMRVSIDHRGSPFFRKETGETCDESELSIRKEFESALDTDPTKIYAGYNARLGKVGFRYIKPERKAA